MALGVWYNVLATEYDEGRLFNKFGLAKMDSSPYKLGSQMGTARISIACENSRFSRSSPLRTFREEELSDRNSILMT